MIFDEAVFEFTGNDGNFHSYSISHITSEDIKADVTFLEERGCHGITVYVTSVVHQDGISYLD